MFKIPFLASTLAGALLSSAAFAHAKLIDSIPANAARVETAPKTLSLSFNENVKLAALALTLAGRTIPVTLDRTAPAAKTVVVPVPALAPGQYEVKWTAISTDDGHVTKGAFTFNLVGTASSH